MELKNPLEVFVAFICRSNNNVKRIQGMVQTFCSLFGDLIVNERINLRRYSFPRKLSHIIESPSFNETTLRMTGFGYRGGFLRSSLIALREDTDRVKSELMGVKYTEQISLQSSESGISPNQVQLCMEVAGNSTVSVKSRLKSAESLDDLLKRMKTEDLSKMVSSAD